jgi:RNA polymerase sigma-70 factor (ECF subfamily)
MADLEAIISRDGPAVWRTAYRLLGNHADADDCFQETFLSALWIIRWGSTTNPRALLQRIATARALDRLRIRYRAKRRETDAAEVHDLCGADPQPVQSAEAAELSERLRIALSVLPPKQAQAFCLFHLEGLNYAQIAAQLDASVNGVGVLLHRARRRLRELLADWAAPEQIKPRT